MAINAAPEHVALVYKALGEEFLVNVEAVHDGKGGYFIEFSTLANYLINTPRSELEAAAAYINQNDTED